MTVRAWRGATSFSEVTLLICNQHRQNTADLEVSALDKKSLYSHGVVVAPVAVIERLMFRLRVQCGIAEDPSTTSGQWGGALFPASEKLWPDCVSVKTLYRLERLASGSKAENSWGKKENFRLIL